MNLSKSCLSGIRLLDFCPVTQILRDSCPMLIPGRDACKMDSGGPLICEIDGYAVLAGITR